MENNIYTVLDLFFKLWNKLVNLSSVLRSVVPNIAPGPQVLPSIGTKLCLEPWYKKSHIIWKPQIKDSLKNYLDQSHYCFNYFNSSRSELHDLHDFHNSLVKFLDFYDFHDSRIELYDFKTNRDYLVEF